MEKEKLIEIIRRAAIAANPEILELKFGCEVKYREETSFLNGETYTIGDVNGGIPPRKFFVLNERIKGVDSFREGDKNVEILGRPIHLADILWAVNQTQNTITIDERGRMYANDKTGPFYDLLKDSLAEQTTETLLFLAELLDSKK